MGRYEAKAKKHDALKLTRQKQGKRRESKYHGEVAKGIRKKKRNLRHKEKKSLFAKLFPPKKRIKKKTKKATKITKAEKKQAIAMAKQINEAFHPKKVVYGIPGVKDERGAPQFAPIGKKALNGKRKTIYVMTNGADGKSFGYKEVKVAHDFGDGYVVSYPTKGKGYVVTHVSTGKQVNGVFRYSTIKDAIASHEEERFKKMAINVDNALKDKKYLDSLQKQMSEGLKQKLDMPEERKKPKEPKKNAEYFAKKGIVFHDNPDFKGAPRGKVARTGSIKTFYAFEKPAGSNDWGYVEKKVIRDLGNGLVIARDSEGKHFCVFHVGSGVTAGNFKKSIKDVENQLENKEWMERLNNAVAKPNQSLLRHIEEAKNRVRPLQE